MHALELCKMGNKVQKKKPKLWDKYAEDNLKRETKNQQQQKRPLWLGHTEICKTLP